MPIACDSQGLVPTKPPSIRICGVECVDMHKLVAIIVSGSRSSGIASIVPSLIPSLTI